MNRFGLKGSPTPHHPHYMHDYKNKGLKKCITRKSLILKDLFLIAHEGQDLTRQPHKRKAGPSSRTLNRVFYKIECTKRVMESQGKPCEIETKRGEFCGKYARSELLRYNPLRNRRAKASRRDSGKREPRDASPFGISYFFTS